MPSGTTESGSKAGFLEWCALAYDSLGYVLYRIMVMVSLVVLKVLFGFEVRGEQYLPKEGPIILAANHFSNLDPWILQVACPRRISYMVQAAYYKSWAWWFYRLHKAIPVGGGVHNKDAFVAGLNVLQEDGVLGIFPEGWGKKVDVRVGRGNPGVAMISCKSNVSVVPAYIDGANEALPKDAIFPRFTRLTVTYGEPISFGSPEKPTKEDMRKMTDEIMQRIRELGGKSK
ncbi:MAG: 1-acyl-sn-glycerol-3-phosphate acyltransferase [Planctomycetes bacterium]|nr:1-acyl-sn-glycerol-3-phosphate acyltransferase [Planctomycetota bacterium]